MYKILIVVQNLKIGGIQRMALDEAYAFKTLGLDVCILTLEPFVKNDFYLLEADLINSHGIEIIFTGQTRRESLLTLKKLIQANIKYKLISHSLRGTVLIKLLKLVNFKCRDNILTISIIHQLPSLSKSIQRHKRFLYASFSDLLFAYSNGVKLDWDLRISGNFIYRFLLRNKNIKILRNGVYLDRLPKVLDYTNSEYDGLRLLFLGRNTGWKGIQTVIDLGENHSLEAAKIHFILPNYDQSFLQNCSAALLKRVSFQIGESISSFKPKIGDVHVYPTNYGASAKFTESISLNCLEMAAIGVPSLVSAGGLDTWPEFIGLSLIREVYWQDINKNIELIKQVSVTKISSAELNFVRDIVDIKNHVKYLIDFFE